MPDPLLTLGLPAHVTATTGIDAMKQTRFLINNPWPVREADALSICEAAL